MRQTNLKAVSDKRPGKLSHEEIRRLVLDLSISTGQDADAVETLLLIGVHLMEYAGDSQYIDTLGMALAQEFFNATHDWSDAVYDHAIKYQHRHTQKGDIQ
jgi:hypothetical protein